MSDTGLTLDALGRGELNSKEAREIALKAAKHEDSHYRLYGALVHFTWDAVMQKRGDDDIRGYHRLLRDTASVMRSARVSPHATETRRDDMAEKVLALSELLRTSIHMTAPLPVLACKEPERQILEFFLASSEPFDFISLEDIIAASGRRRSRCFHYVSSMVVKGLLERDPVKSDPHYRLGRSAFELTQAFPDKFPRVLDYSAKEVALHA